MDIVIENLSKAYDNQKVLDNISVTFPDKSFTCLMGKSGVGKTTLLSILMGLEQADAGFVTGLDDKKISVVFQENRLCNNLTALVNIKMVIDKESGMTDAKILEYLRRIGLGEDVKKPVQEYSGGMKRRVAILRALLADFDLLIMDEPLKGLDDATKMDVINLIKELTKEKTVIMTTHDDSEADVFNAQIISTIASISYAFLGTLLILYIIDKISGLRVSEFEELQGLDISQHGENAYRLQI